MAVWLITWSLNHRWLVIGIAVLVAIVGLFSLSCDELRRLSRHHAGAGADQSPAPALVPEEIERQITFPIELAISGIGGLEEVRSVSQFGLSQRGRHVSRRHRHLSPAS